MKIYAVLTGCYENIWLSGVYSSPEKAMASHPVPADYKYPDKPSAYNSSVPGGWKKISETEWSNGLDWDNAAHVHEYELDE